MNLIFIMNLYTDWVKYGVTSCKEKINIRKNKIEEHAVEEI